LTKPQTLTNLLDTNLLVVGLFVGLFVGLEDLGLKPNRNPLSRTQFDTESRVGMESI
jgi:hypothetical protein